MSFSWPQGADPAAAPSRPDYVLAAPPDSADPSAGGHGSRRSAWMARVSPLVTGSTVILFSGLATDLSPPWRGVAGALMLGTCLAWFLFAVSGALVEVVRPTGAAHWIAAIALLGAVAVAGLVRVSGWPAWTVLVAVLAFIVLSWWSTDRPAPRSAPAGR